MNFSMLKGVGPTTLRKIASMRNFEEISVDEIAFKFPTISKALQETAAWDKAIEGTDRQIEEARSRNARIISPMDEEYPSLLAATRDDPFLIFVCGRLASNPEKSVAVIGTREPTAHGVKIAQRIAQFFTEKRWSVVSGLAIGCDAIAHQATLDTNGHTVAVLAHGLHTIAPTRHRKLAEDILASGGALVSEYRFGQNAQPQQFVKRDRTQAGMAQGVVMIQSDVKGGSLHASRAALEYNRWLAVPYPTALDRANLEPKIQANLVIAEGESNQRAELLRCAPSALGKIIILQGKEDYPRMIDSLSNPGSLPSSHRGSLI
ncbi:DNA-processing protein DprA [Mesorhizobium sp. M0030]|uniref:DNA-processing protein DprA n=1 Tax=Mesorhizobium sp. M0030 TaxID=2956851 RepID=UPI003337C530